MTREERRTPFIFSAVVIILDQVTKALVVACIAEDTVKFTFLGGWLRIVHVRNTAVAFSMGTNLAEPLKVVLFIGLPLILMVGVAMLLALKRFDGEFTKFQRYALSGILAGGLGNLIDRIFRSMRVVDFISVYMNGFLGMQWFPTFNVADASVTICVILLILSLIFDSKRDKETLDE